MPTILLFLIVPNLVSYELDGRTNSYYGGVRVDIDAKLIFHAFLHRCARF